MIVFGGMNDEKDYNDIAILQTRAAAKQLPPVMSGGLLSNLKPSDTKVQVFEIIKGPAYDAVDAYNVVHDRIIKHYSL